MSNETARQSGPRAGAMRWLAGQLAWERTLAALRTGAPAPTPVAARRPQHDVDRRAA